MSSLSLAQALRELRPPGATSSEHEAQRREAMRIIYETLVDIVPRLTSPGSMPDESTSDLEALRLEFCSQALTELCKHVGDRRGDDDGYSTLPSTDSGTRGFLATRLRWVQQRHFEDVNQRRDMESLDDTGADDEASPRERLLVRVDTVTHRMVKRQAEIRELQFEQMRHVLAMFRRLGQTLALLQRRRDARKNLLQQSTLVHQLLMEKITPEQLYTAIGGEHNTVQRALSRHRDAFEQLLKGYRDVKSIQPMTAEGAERIRTRGLRGLHVERFVTLCNTPGPSVEHIPEDLGDDALRTQLAEAFVRPWELTEPLQGYLHNLLGYLRSGAPMRQ